MNRKLVLINTINKTLHLKVFFWVVVWNIKHDSNRFNYITNNYINCIATIAIDSICSRQAQTQSTRSSTKATEAIKVNYSAYACLLASPPLFLAVSRCKHEALDLLLTYGACPNIQDPLGNTPLHLAVAKRQPCYQCSLLLLKNHATALAFNNTLQSPLSILNQISHALLTDKANAETRKEEPNTSSASNWNG